MNTKNKAILSLAIAMGVLAWGGAAREPKHSVVILQGTPAFHRLNEKQYQWSEITIYCSSSSSNAPGFVPATFNQDGTVNASQGLADAIAGLLDEGYRMEHRETVSGVLTVWLVKK